MAWTQRLKAVTGSWATRSLLIGAVATGIDLSLASFLFRVLHAPTRGAAMAGTALGATVTFLANRYFAFHEHKPKLAAPAIRFAVVTVISSTVHAQLTVMLHNWLTVLPFEATKMIADFLVFTGAQLFFLRYVVFPKPKPALKADADAEVDEPLP